MAEGDRKRELALPPGTYAYVLDGTKGSIKTHVGPCTLTLTNQDKPVRFNQTTYKFDDCSLEEAVQQNIVAPEGFYIELRNPAKTRGNVKQGTNDSLTASFDMHPDQGRPNDTPDFQIGEKENIPGPASFALYPGQMAEVRRGHHLRLNEYLRIKIYNDDKAKANWAKAVVKVTEGAPTQTDPNAPPAAAAAPVATKAAPSDLAVGKQYNIVGKEVSFYIPPTGVSVVPDETTHDFVRDAETLEQLEYSILVDEDGNKEYPRGPAVVFPRPTQQFQKDSKGNRKFRAVEMNELQGIQLKFTNDLKLKFVTGEEKSFKAGEEVFITGKEMPIYFPEEGHQLVRYDGKTIHYAVAVPEGEARYLMDRKTGKIETVNGPTMMLPNPVTQIIVRRALSDSESISMFPGPTGTGSLDALTYNRTLRELSANEPTTRQGVVGEGSVQRFENSGPQASSGDVMSYASNTGGFEGLDAFANAALERGVKAAQPRRMAKGAMVPESRQGKNQDAMLGDVAERKSTFNEPRTLTFGSRFKGVPTIKVSQGYAVQVADSAGQRRVEVGPKTILLEYAETLDVLALSTSKPKNTDTLFRTAYLNVKNNKVSDIIIVETVDHVKVSVKLSYNVNFEGDPSKWFSIENYVKHLCDHGRSVLKGRVKKEKIESFYNTATDFIRDNILGVPAPQTPPDATAPSAVASIKRPGMFFAENGMRITDVEVLGVDIVDQAVATLMAQAQQQVVQQNINLAQARARLEMVRASEDLARQEAEAKALTTERKIELESKELTARLALELDKIGNDTQKHAETQKQQQVIEATRDFGHKAALLRKQEEIEQEQASRTEEQQRWLVQIKAQTDAVAAQMAAIDPNLSAALMSTSAQETLVKVSKELSFHQILGGENAVDVLRKVFANTPLEAVMLKALGSLPALPANGAGKGPSPVA